MKTENIIKIENNKILSDNSNNYINNNIYVFAFFGFLCICVVFIGFNKIISFFKLLYNAYKIFKNYINREKIKAKIIDIDAYRNIFEISIEIKNNGRNDLLLRFINDRNNFKPNKIKGMIPNFYDNSPFYKANNVEKYMKFNGAVFKYCIYMRKLEEIDKWIYEIIIPPKYKVSLFILIGRDENKQENLKSINQKTSLEFRTENGTKCIANWDNKKCKEWMKKQENF